MVVVRNFEVMMGQTQDHHVCAVPYLCKLFILQLLNLTQLFKLVL
jgi:hypothetical protein